MKKFFLLSLSVLMCTAAFAQTRTGSVGGRLLGKQSGTPLEYAAVALCAPTTLILTPYCRYTFNKMTVITEVLDGSVVKTAEENMSSSSAAGTEAL